MTTLPQATLLGELEVLEVFEHFDGPRLFSCRNHADTRFLAVWVDEDPVETWLYVPVSEFRLAELNAGRFELRTTFAEPEDGFTYVVRLPAGDQKPEVTPVPADQVVSGYLPEPGTKLRPLDTPAQQRSAPPDFLRRAIQSNRETVGLELNFGDPRKFEGPAKVVGAVLATFQDVLDAIGQALIGQATARGTVPEYLRARTQMSVVSTYAGSFGLELAADELPNLFGESLARDSLSAFSGLLAARADRIELREVLGPLRVRSAVRYRQFLRSVADGEASLQFDWASPARIHRTVEMTAGQAGVAARVISEFESVPPEEFRVDGALTMGDVMSQRFTIVSQSDGQQFTGRVLGTAAEALSHATLNDQYSALVREVRSTTTTTDRETVRYELLELAPMDLEVGGGSTSEEP